MSDPVAPLPAPSGDESNVKIILRLIGFIGLLAGILLGANFGGRWWFFGPAVFVGTALLYGTIEIVQRELRKGRHR